MTVNVTERDKKLLAGLAVFCAAVLFFLYVFLPLYTANAAIRQQIRENEERVSQMQQKEAGLPALRAQNEAQKKALAKAQQELYPMMKSQEIDRLLTGKTLRCGLSARKLQITMPKEAANVIGYERVNDSGSNPDKLDGLWIAQVSLEVTGTMEKMDRLIDELALDTSGVVIRRLAWGRSRRQTDAGTGRTEAYDILSLQLDVLMSRKE